MTFEWDDEKAVVTLAKHGVASTKPRQFSPIHLQVSVPILIIRFENDDSMKKRTSPDVDDLRPEYRTELFATMKRNRFAGRELTFKGQRVVYLDKDVAEVFDTPEAVNTVLRSAIRAMRTATSPRKESRPKRRAS